jgi:4a-hydroxytetrahydrobiopterin dehydratase
MESKSNTLAQKTCKPCEGKVATLQDAEIQTLLKEIPSWELSDINDIPFIYRVFDFKNYYQTIAFVNAIAWMTHHENHHPILEVGYNHCKVSYWTHNIKGLSENDFICAKKVDSLSSE